MKKKLLLLLLMFIPFFINAKEFKLEWQKNIGGSDNDYFKGAIITKNNEIVVVGYTDSKDIEGLDTNTGSDAIIVKYDTSGNIIWKNTLAGNNSDYFYSVIETLEEEYIVVGSSESTDIEGITINGSSDAVIVKYSKSGDVIWKKSFGGNGTEKLNSIKLSNTGEFIAVGSYASTDIENFENNGSSDALIIKGDNNGNILWKSSLGGTLSEEFLDIDITSNEEYIAVGNFYSQNIDDITKQGTSPIMPDCIIVKFDRNGNVLWKKSYGDINYDIYETIVVTSNNEYIALGYITPLEITNDMKKYGLQDALIVKYNSDGEIVFKNNWGGAKIEGYISSALTNDNKIIAVGESNSEDIEGIEKIGGYDAIIQEYDTNGNLIIQRTYGGTSNELFVDVFIKNNEIVVVGNSMSSDIDGIRNYGKEDALIVKYSIKYDIKNLTKSYGTATAVQQGSKGIITPTPDKGYEVDQIIIKDSEGNILDIETTKLEDGTYSFPLYADVSIEVTFKEKVDNPKTGLLDYGAILSLFMLLPILALVYICRYNQKYGL